MDKVTFYTTHCAQCSILKKKLDTKGIKYDTIEGEDEILKLGYSQAPLLKVNDTIMTFVQAVKYVNEVSV